MPLFKEILELWRSNNSLTRALSDSHRMLEDTREMFKDSITSLRQRDDGEINMDVYKKDQLVNRFEKEVRRNVLKHLVITGGMNIAPGLVLTSIVIDIERIGDYTKNIVDLAIAHPGKLEGGKYEEEFQKLESSTGNLFDSVLEALKSSDRNVASALLKENWWIMESCDGIITSLVKGEGNSHSPADAAALAVYSRYLKRIAGHLINITTSVVNPFEGIGFHETEEDSET